VLTAVANAIDRRETVCNNLDGERESLDQSRDGLLVIIDELDGTRVPVGVGVDFTDALDEVARHRQETLASRTTSPRTNGHDLCAYLYVDYDWTYPVLTAVTRFAARSTMQIRDETVPVYSSSMQVLRFIYSYRKIQL